MKLSLLGTAALLSSPSLARAFSLPPQHHHHRQPIITLKRTGPLFSEPSDTSNDDWDEIVDIDIVEEEEKSTAATTSTTVDENAVVTNLMDLMPSAATADVSAETRAAINEALYQMEKLNPTKETTVSPLLNGIWDLRYAGGYSSEGALASPTRQLALFLYSGGYSPALFVLSTLQKLLPGNVVELKNLEVTISRSQPRVEGLVKFSIANGAFVGTAKVTSRLETMSTVRMKETYESASFQEFTPVEIPQFLQYSRDVYVTYVDDDLLIVRDASGVPEVLVRKNKEFPSWDHGPEPDAADL